MTDAGEVRYRITGDASGLDRSFDNVRDSANNAGQSITEAANAAGRITENAGQANNALTATAEAAARISGSAEAAAQATQRAAQSTEISREAYEAALSSQQRLAAQITATQDRLATLRAMEADMAAAQQSGDISAAAYQRYQRELQQTAERLSTLNVQQGALSSRIEEMNRNLSSTANASGNAEGALRDTERAAAGAADNVRDISRAADQVDRSTNAAANNGAFKKIEDAAKKAASATLKAVGVATTAAVGMVAALSKEAVESYSQYEQLVGGVETLFKDSADITKGYADEAYKTAGLSANAYMETVTGFSASLLQGLEGDTAKAAEVANQAVTDMSDNANKMGTDMQSIQNAYQGFAKANYTINLMSAA